MLFFDVVLDGTWESECWESVCSGLVEGELVKEFLTVWWVLGSSNLSTLTMDEGFWRFIFNVSMLSVISLF